MTMPFEKGVAHECDDCSQAFTDKANQLSIFNTDRCLECESLNAALQECTEGVEEPEVDQEMANFFTQSYACAT